MSSAGSDGTSGSGPSELQVPKDANAKLRSMRRVYSLKKSNLEKLRQAFIESGGDESSAATGFLRREIDDLTKQLSTLVAEVEALEDDLARKQQEQLAQQHAHMSQMSSSSPGSPASPGQKRPQYGHRYQAKLFLNLGTSCGYCHKRVFQGMRCDLCDYRCHKGCVARSSDVCSAEAEQVYRRLLALSCPTTPIAINALSGKDRQQQQQQQLAMQRHEARSDGDSEGGSRPSSVATVVSSPSNTPTSATLPALASSTSHQQQSHHHQHHHGASPTPKIRTLGGGNASGNLSLGSPNGSQAGSGTGVFDSVSLSSTSTGASRPPGTPDSLQPPQMVIHSSADPADRRPSDVDTLDSTSLRSFISATSRMSGQSSTSARTGGDTASAVGTLSLNGLTMMGDSLSDAGSDDEEGPRVPRNSKEWEIPFGDLDLGERIGAGAFGTVYKAKWHGDVAVKILKVQNASESCLQDFRREIAVLRKTRHQNIVLFMGASTALPHLAIVTQWCEGRTLYRHLHVEEASYTMIQIVGIAFEIAQGMEYLHAKNILHRDLKSNNVFLNSNLQVNIGDFGLSTVKQLWDESSAESARVCTPAGSVLWMAPEVIRMPSTPNTPASDVYSFGIVLYEMLTRRLPYSDRELAPDQVMFMVGMGLLKPDPLLVLKGSPPMLVELMEHCYSPIADSRPSFRHVLKLVEKIEKALVRLKRAESSPGFQNKQRKLQAMARSVGVSSASSISPLTP